MDNAIAQSETGSNAIRKGAFMGYCPACGLVIAEFDKLQTNYRCPGCDKVFAIPTETAIAAKKAPTMAEIFGASKGAPQYV